MQKLRNIIEQHARWKDLGILIERIEAHMDVDFSLSLENAKALLESIAKEICSQKNVVLPASPKTNWLLKQSFLAIGYKGDDLISQVSTALANIAQQMGNLRNDIGLTSHGMSLDELRKRNKKVGQFTKELLVDTTGIVASLLIRSFESHSPSPTQETKNDVPDYKSNNNFNEYWDETFGEFSMGAYSYPASEILYNVDPQAYAIEHNSFKAEA